MATYNTVIKKRNDANDGWDSILPITLAENVLIDESGNTVASILPVVSNRTIYVSVSTGDDLTGDGSVSLPYKTITKALSTINKTLYSDIKIRVLAGNYASEGAISISNFSKRIITVTAFDGNSDILTVSDLYNVFQFNVTGNDEVIINGFNMTYDGVDSYCIYTANTRYAIYNGIKAVAGSKINSGFGCTENSFVHVDNCLVANKSTVVSCNNGARVLAKNFIAGSINNTNGLWSHGAGIIFKSGTQATCTNPTIATDGGKVFEQDGGIKTASALQTFNVASDTVVTVMVTLDNKPTWVKVDAVLTGSQARASGSWSGIGLVADGDQQCVFNKGDGIGAGSYTEIAVLHDGGANLVNIRLTEVANYYIRFSVTPSGGGLTGTGMLNILCG